MAAIDRKSASGFVHGFRYNIRTLYHILENRFFSSQLPHSQLETKGLQSIADKIISRCNALIGIAISDTIIQFML